MNVPYVLRRGAFLSAGAILPILLLQAWATPGQAAAPLALRNLAPRFGISGGLFLPTGDLVNSREPGESLQMTQLTGSSCTGQLSISPWRRFGLEMSGQYISSGVRLRATIDSSFSSSTDNPAHIVATTLKLVYRFYSSSDMRITLAVAGGPALVHRSGKIYDTETLSRSRTRLAAGLGLTARRSLGTATFLRVDNAWAFFPYSPRQGIDTRWQRDMTLSVGLERTLTY
jgi:hypothetical protein